MMYFNIDDEVMQSVRDRKIDAHINKKIFTYEGGQYEIVYTVKPLYMITVNGENYHITKNKIFYDDLVNMSMTSYSPYYSITYRNGFFPKSEGILSLDEEVCVQSGMIFNIAMTDNA